MGLSIGVQRMVRSDLGTAGVMFTIDTESGFTDVILISASYGLGESVVKGRVDPDEFLVFKPLSALVIVRSSNAPSERNRRSWSMRLAEAAARRLSPRLSRSESGSASAMTMSFNWRGGDSRSKNIIRIERGILSPWISSGPRMD